MVTEYGLAMAAPQEGGGRPPRPARESWEVREAAYRMMRALVRRAGEGDEAALEDLAKLAESADRLLGDAVRAYRSFRPAKGEGYSWADVARILGVTRQAAQQHYGGGGGDVGTLDL